MRVGRPDGGDGRVQGGTWARGEGLEQSEADGGQGKGGQYEDLEQARAARASEEKDRSTEEGVVRGEVSAVCVIVSVRPPT